MPIHVRISHHDRLAVCVAHGTISTEDIQNAVKEFVGSAAVHYRKLVDVAAARPSDTDLERIKAILNFIRATPTAAERGPVAFVVDANRGELVRELAGLTEEGERPLRVFTKLHEARRWLDEISQVKLKR
jgi:hypothetical protein